MLISAFAHYADAKQLPQFTRPGGAASSVENVETLPSIVYAKESEIITMKANESTGFRENSFEHALIITRGDERVEVTLTHLPDIAGEGKAEPLFSFATMDAPTSEEGDIELKQVITFSLSQARLINDFMSWLCKEGQLEEE